MANDLLMRQRIVQAAIELYKDGEEDASEDAIAEAAGVPIKAFYASFDNRHDVLPAYYLLTTELYEATCAEIDGYAAFSTEERAATLIFTLFDLFESERPFVQATFERFWWGGAWSSDFRRRKRSD